MGFEVNVNDASKTTIVGEAAPAAAPAGVKKGDKTSQEEMKDADQA